jgi:broad specificity phosphatase PhoE
MASILNPELVVVSPLLRAVQTAKLSFSDFYQNPKIPWIAHEGCREELGVLVCNKRRPLSQIMEDFPDLQFWEMTEEDSLWDPTQRESNESKSGRIYEFLVEFIANRPESEIAVIGHSAWLFHMCNAVVDCGDDEGLTSWFLTSEIRSMRLTFTRE